MFRFGFFIVWVTSCLVCVVIPCLALAAPISLPKEVGPKPRIIAPSEYSHHFPLAIGPIRYSTFLNRETLLVVGAEKSILIDLKSGRQQNGPEVNKALTGANSGGLIAIGTETGLRVFRNKEGQWNEIVHSETRGPVSVVHILPQEEKVVFQSAEKELAILKISDRSTEAKLELDTVPLAVAYAPNGRHVAIVGRDGWIRYRGQFAGGKENQYWMRRVQRAEHSTISFSPDGRWVATASAGRVVVFDTLNGRQLAGLERRFGEGEVRTVQFSPDGSRLACIYSGESAVCRVWQTENWKEIAEYGVFANGGETLCFSRDSQLLATSGRQGELWVWPFRSVEQLKNHLTLAQAWENLDSDQVSQAQAAYQKLLSAGEEGVKVVIAGLKVIEKQNQEIKKCLKNLDDPSFKIREKARQELAQQGTRAAWIIYEWDTSKMDTEAANAIRTLKLQLEEKGFSPSQNGLYGNALRRARAVSLLEKSTSDEAWKMLKNLADEEEPSYAQREAKAILSTRKDRP